MFPFQRFLYFQLCCYSAKMLKKCCGAKIAIGLWSLSPSQKIPFLFNRSLTAYPLMKYKWTTIYDPSVFNIFNFNIIICLAYQGHHNISAWGAWGVLVIGLGSCQNEIYCTQRFSQYISLVLFYFAIKSWASFGPFLCWTTKFNTNISFQWLGNTWKKIHQAI